MSSRFYNRYIPPTAPASVNPEQERPAKKRKKSSAAPSKSSKRKSLPKSGGDAVAKNHDTSSSSNTKKSEQSVDERNPQNEAPQSQVPKPQIVGVVKKETKKKSKRKRDDDSNLPETLIDKDNQALSNRRNSEKPSLDIKTSKHKKIHSKYQKAVNESVEKAKTDRVDGEEMQSDDGGQTHVNGHGLEPLPQPRSTEEVPKVSLSSALPEWLRKPTLVSSTETVPMSSFPVDNDIIDNLKEKDCSAAFPIQSAVLPMLLPGPEHYAGDICISAATGSGKTLAYALPMVQSLRSYSDTKLRGLVVVPTRELVAQAKQMLDTCNGRSELKIATAVGSKSLKEEQDLLVHKGQIYNPEAYQAEQRKKVNKNEPLMNWDFDEILAPKDDFELFVNHAVQYMSKIDILICTPGRLIEHVQSTKGFTLEHVQWLVIDEADRLLNESFQQWVDIVLPALEEITHQDPIMENLMTNVFHSPLQRKIRKVVLSATMTNDVGQLSALRLNRPRLVVLQSPTKTKETSTLPKSEAGEVVGLPATLEEIAIPIPVKDIEHKVLYLIKLLESAHDLLLIRHPEKANQEDTILNGDRPESRADSEKAGHEPEDTSLPSGHPEPLDHGFLIFTRDNENASRLARLLELLRPDWKPRIGTLTKSSSKSSRRDRTLSDFSNRKLSILTASDRASRGLDIPNLAHVVNYDMPNSVTNYIHRVGRTARAGKRGIATTFVEHNQGRWFWKDPEGIAQSGGSDRNLVRREWKIDFMDEELKSYEEALEALGRDVQGEKQ